MVDLFNFGNGICGDQAFNLIMSNLPMLIIAAAASTPLATMLYAYALNTDALCGFPKHSTVWVFLLSARQALLIRATTRSFISDFKTAVNN